MVNVISILRLSVSPSLRLSIAPVSDGITLSIGGFPQLKDSFRLYEDAFRLSEDAFRLSEDALSMSLLSYFHPGYSFHSPFKSFVVSFVFFVSSFVPLWLNKFLTTKCTKVFTKAPKAESESH